MNLIKRLLQRDILFTVPVDKDAPWQSEEFGELAPLNRTLVFVRPRQPYVNWVHKIEGKSDFNLAYYRRFDSLAYLVPTTEGDLQEAEGFVAEYWSHFFAQALSGYAFKPDAWPEGRTLTMFRHWFDVEVCDVVLDLGSFAA